jgi:hypothetical protein
MNSFCKHNHILCCSLIPKSTEGELVYTGTCEGVQVEAVMQLLDICEQIVVALMPVASFVRSWST